MPNRRNAYARNIVPSVGQNPDISNSPLKLYDKHRRYESDFEDDIVVIDIAHRDAKSKTLRPYDLTKLEIDVSGGESVFVDGRLPLHDFPHLLDSLKAAINITLHVKTSGVGDAVTNTINHGLRLFHWMIKRGVNRLEQLEMEDMEEYAELWANKGWWKIGRYCVALKTVLATAKKDISIAEALHGSGHVRRFTLNGEELSRQIGLPLSPNYIPSWFERRMAKLLGVQNDYQPRKSRSRAITKNNYLTFLTEINKFSLLPGGFDSISFVPFPDPNKRAKSRFSKPSSQTANLSLDDAIEIFSAGCKCIYDYGPAVAELCEIARTALEYAIAKGVSSDSIVKNALNKALPLIKAKYDFDFYDKTTLTIRDLGELVSMIQIGAFCLIASNHGRRRSEIIGKDVPHGLYFGCVSPITEARDEHRIEVYIAKSIRDYVPFWCNKIVVDSVALLEKLAQHFRPLNTTAKCRSSDPSEARVDKLFTQRNFTRVGFSSDPEPLDFSRKAGHFFKLTNVSPDVINERTRPFRRLFCQIYKNRYDHPLILAMKQHLGHELVSTTNTYWSDSAGVDPRVSSAVLYARAASDRAGFRSELDAVGSESFERQIIAILKGENVGGLFPRLILSTMQQLSENIEFRQLPASTKATVIRKKFEKWGYKPDEKEHCVCMAGTADRTRSSSNCYSDGSVHPEDASPEMCSGCLHMLTTSNYRAGLAHARDSLLVEAGNNALPRPLRFVKNLEAEFLTNFIEKDCLVAERNQEIMAALVNRWADVVPVEEMCK